MEKSNGEVLFTRKASGWFKGLAIIMVIASHYAEWITWFFTTEGNAELFRNAASRLGPYGVAVFFVFSGYGLAKSAGEERVGLHFVGKRLTGVYIPYLILAVLIEYLSDCLHNIDDFIKILYGSNFWYMTVLFLFYIAFAVLWAIFKNRHLRAIGMTIFTILLNFQLMKMEMQDFWYLSNYAFLIGVLLTLYEDELIRISTKIRIIGSIIFGAASAWIVRTALFTEQVWETPKMEINSHLLAVLFTLFIVFIASVWKWYDVVLQFIGKYSLYLYLLHTFIFMWAVNYFQYAIGLRMLVAVLITVLIAVGFGMLYSAATKGITGLTAGKEKHGASY